MKRTSFSGLLLLLATVACASHARGQGEIHHIPPFIDQRGFNPDLVQPFVDADTFSHDYQFFAPADVDLYGHGPQPNTGWFGSYDRVYIYVTRPDVARGRTEGDFTWGNRFTLGYMTEEDHGWLAELWHIDGPNVYDRTIVERVNVILTDDEINFDSQQNIDLRGGGGGGGGGNQQNQQRLGYPERDRNDPATHARDYILHDSENVAKLGSFEINKTFRWKPLHHGSVIEPFLGFRYMDFQDFDRIDAYTRINGVTGVPVGQVPPTTEDPNDLDDELYTTTQSAFNNQMVGGQIGLRWFKQKSHWLLSSEVRAFALQNFQYLETVTKRELTFYGDVGPGETPEGVFNDQTLAGANSAEFVFGGEVRAQAAYEVTRDISLQMGISFLEFGRGIGRGTQIQNNDQEVTMFGITGGLVINR